MGWHYLHHCNPLTISGWYPYLIGQWWGLTGRKYKWLGLANTCNKGLTLERPGCSITKPLLKRDAVPFPLSLKPHTCGRTKVCNEICRGEILHYKPWWKQTSLDLKLGYACLQESINGLMDFWCLLIGLGFLENNTYTCNATHLYHPPSGLFRGMHSDRGKCPLPTYYYDHPGECVTHHGWCVTHQVLILSMQSLLCFQGLVCCIPHL